MGILITPNTETIRIVGTDLELESAYVRLRFFAEANGRDMEIVYKVYSSKENYELGLPVNTSISDGNIKVTLTDPLEEQTLETAQLKAVEAFINTGFNAKVS